MRRLNSPFQTNEPNMTSDREDRTTSPAETTSPRSSRVGSIACVTLLLAIFAHPTRIDFAIDSKDSTVRELTQPDLRFVDATLEWGVTAAHQQTSERLEGLDETLGGGVCIFDVDRDDFLDIFVVGGMGLTRDYGRASWWAKQEGNRLLVNEKGVWFRDRTEEFGLSHRMHGMGCSSADLDSDGFTDLLVTGRDDLRLFRNVGGRSFEDVTERSGIDRSGWITGAAIADYDDDDHLDIYLTRYIRYQRNARTFERESGFRNQLDPAFDATLYDPQPNRLYRNLGNLRFSDVAGEIGVADARGRSLGARWEDFDRDEALDLFVINDVGSPSQLFVADGNGGFSVASGGLAALQVEGVHDLQAFPVDQSDRLLFVMSRGRGEPTAALMQSPAAAAMSDVAWRVGLARSDALAMDGWGLARGDFDNDGTHDLFVANGSILPDADSRYVPTGQPDSIFIRRSSSNSLSFDRVESIVDASSSRSSRGAVAADLDNDGRLEIVVSRNNDTLRILRSVSPARNWIGFDLSDLPESEWRMGGRLILKLESDRVIQVSLDPPVSFLSAGPRRVHSGIPSNDSIAGAELVSIRGRKISIRRPASNRYWRVHANGEVREMEAHLESNLFRVGVLAELPDSAHVDLFALLASGDSARDLRRLAAAVWEAGTSESRAAMLEGLQKSESALRLEYLRRALVDSAPDIRLRAIAMLRDAELESSVEWLTPLVRDSIQEVACATSELFAHFFDEEEAVTHRKALAVVPLIRALEDPRADVAACAANALAAAESKRAIGALVELASGESAPEARAAAIRALGLVRDKKSLAVLESITADQAESATVTAAGLIALSRLGSPSVEAFLLPSLRRGAREGDRGSARALRVLALLLRSEEAVILDVETVRAVVSSHVGDARSVLGAAGSDAHDWMLAAIAAMGASRQDRYVGTLGRAARSGQDDVASSALVALAEIGSPSADASLRVQLPKAPPVVVASVLSRTGELGVRLSPPSFASTFFRTDDLAAARAEYLRSLPLTERRALTQAILSPQSGLDDSSWIAFATECGRESVRPELPPDRLNADRGLAMRLAAARCILGVPAGNDRPLRPRAEAAAIDRLDSSPSLDVATRLALVALVKDESIDREVRDTILVAAATRDRILAESLLAGRISALQPSLLPAGIQALARQGQIEPLASWLVEVLNDPTTVLATRVSIALSLTRLGREDARDSVLGAIRTP